MKAYLSLKSLKKLAAHVSDSRVFFSIPTLEYLKKGGRIGLVSSILGTALNLNPVISCNTMAFTIPLAKLGDVNAVLKKC